MDKFDKEKENSFYTILLSALIYNDICEWDEMATIESRTNSYVDKEYTDYFNRIFSYGIPTCQLPMNTSLFRARQIKESDADKLGACIADLDDLFLKLFLSDEDISKMEQYNKEGGIKFSLKHIFMLKLLENNCLSEEQLKKAEEFITYYSMPRTYGFSEKDSRVPPVNCRKEGRLNTANDDYLYLSLDKATAVYEMRPSIGQKYSIATFRTNNELKIVDLSGEHFDINKDNATLNSLAHKISEPNTENNSSFYCITQHMSHILKQKGYDGIKYKSSLKKESNNILIFDETNVDFICSDIISVNDVNILFSTILPCNFESNNQNTGAEND